MLTVKKKNHNCQNLANAKGLHFLFLTFTTIEGPTQHSISDLSVYGYYAVQKYKRLQK